MAINVPLKPGDRILDASGHAYVVLEVRQGLIYASAEGSDQIVVLNASKARFCAKRGTL